MKKEEILERMIANDISGDEANLILYNSFLIISWMELILKMNHEEAYRETKPFIDNFRGGNITVQKGLSLTDLLAEEGLRRGDNKPEKAKRDNIISFPAWGIKLK